MKRILDLGVGGARYKPRSRIVFEFNAKFYFCDKYPLRGIDYCDVEKDLPYPSNYFDKVYCSHVLEHLDDPLKALKNINRVLKKNGKLILYLPNWISKDAINDHDHKHIFNIVKVWRLLEKAGFKPHVCYGLKAGSRIKPSLLRKLVTLFINLLNNEICIEAEKVIDYEEI